VGFFKEVEVHFLQKIRLTTAEKIPLSLKNQTFSKNPTSFKKISVSLKIIPLSLKLKVLGFSKNASTNPINIHKLGIAIVNRSFIVPETVHL